MATRSRHVKRQVEQAVAEAVTKRERKDRGNARAGSCAFGEGAGFERGHLLGRQLVGANRLDDLRLGGAVELQHKQVQLLEGAQAIGPGC
jgi:hypothetical protein